MLAYVARAAWLGLVLLMIGVVAFPLAANAKSISDTGRRDTVRANAARIGFRCALLCFIVIGARLYVQLDGMRFPGDPLMQSFAPIMSATLWGKAWIAQIVATAFALVGFRAMRHTGRPNVFAVLGVCVIVATFPMSGHAAAVQPSATVSMIADGLHVLTAGAWVGTLAVIASCVLGLGPRAHPLDSTDALGVVTTFSPFALFSAATVTTTGVIRALASIKSIDALLHSTYGQTLLVKVAFVGVVVLLGALNWKRNTALLQSGDPRGMRAGVQREILAAVCVVAATAVLISTPEP